jgi:hypothetical protein
VVVTVGVAIISILPTILFHTQPTSQSTNNSPVANINVNGQNIESPIIIGPIKGNITYNANNRFNNDITNAAKSNLLPKLYRLSPDKSSPQMKGATINWAADALDDDAPIFYKFFLNGKQETDWRTDNTWIWETSEDDVDDNRIEVWVRDGKHAGPNGYDDNYIYPSLFSLESKKQSPISSISAQPNVEGSGVNSPKKANGTISGYVWNINGSKISNPNLSNKLYVSTLNGPYLDPYIRTNENYFSIYGGFPPHSTYRITCDMAPYEPSAQIVTTDDSGEARCDFYLAPYNDQAQERSSGQLPFAGDALQWNEKGVSILNQSSCDSCIKSSYNCSCLYEALEAFDKANELNPSLADAWGNRGLTLYLLGRYDEAILACDKAIELSPSMNPSYWQDVVLGHAWATKGDVLWSKGAYDESRVASKNYEDAYSRAKMKIGRDYRMPWLTRAILPPPSISGHSSQTI